MPAPAEAFGRIAITSGRAEPVRLPPRPVRERTGSSGLGHRMWKTVRFPGASLTVHSSSVAGQYETFSLLTPVRVHSRTGSPGQAWYRQLGMFAPPSTNSGHGAETTNRPRFIAMPCAPLTVEV